MRRLDHDVRRRPRPATRGSRVATGLAFAVVSAAFFSLSGPLARGLLDQGWSPGAAVTLRVLIGAAVLLVPALVALRGRWGLLRRNLGLILAFGVIAVAGVQFSFFMAVTHLQVGIALLIEYAAPAVVVLWMWARHGQRPSRLTVLGSLIAAVGLVLVLDLVSGGGLSTSGLLWALLAMVSLAVYFVLSADEGGGLPPIVLAAGGLTVAGVALSALGLVGVLPMRASTAQVILGSGTLQLDWFWPVIALGLLTAALAYVTGIAASRRLGPRLASFAGLSEVVFALLFAWLLLAEVPGPVQAGGGALILTGVVLIRMGEPRVVPPPGPTSAPIGPPGPGDHADRTAP